MAQVTSIKRPETIKSDSENEDFVTAKKIIKASGLNPNLFGNLTEGDNLIQRFLAFQDIKESSKSTYHRALKPFFAHLQAKGILIPTRGDILQFKGFLERQGLSPLTISGYIVAIRKFFEWTEDGNLYPNISKKIKGTKRVQGFRKDALSVDQLKGLLNSIDKNSLPGKRDYALLNLMIRTGLRTIEIVRANIQDVKRERGEAILSIQGKGRDSKDEFVLLTEETLKPIEEYLQARSQVKGGEPLFASLSDKNNGQRLTTRSVSRIVKEHLRGIGLNDGRLSAHSLRHTAITLSLIAGASLQEAQAMARHSSIATTLLYAHNLDRLNNAPEKKIGTLLQGNICNG
jgi:integrase/recombinase XerC/integrase/recombinase XerD